MPENVQTPRGPFAIKSQMQFKTGSGPLNVLTESPYDFKKTQYPAEGLGSTVPSYVVFYVNVAAGAKWAVESENFVPDAYSISDQNIQNTRGASNPKLITGDAAKIAAAAATLSTVEQVATDAVQNKLGEYFSAEKLGGMAMGKLVKGVGVGVLGSVAQNVEKKPKMQRIKEAVAIYMPDTVMHTYSHDYDVQSLTSAMGELGRAQRGSGNIKDGVMSTIGNIFSENTPTNPQVGFSEIVGNIAEKTGLAGAGYTDFLLRGKGLALNPQVELLFKGTANRGFIFDFKFQPKNQKESETINNIIYIFRRYAAPMLSATVTDPGAYFIPPAQFDIQYYFKNEENKHIGRISTCVLENIDINYSSAGQYATFNDGAPVEINMQLRFKEVDILTRHMIDEGF